MLNKTIIKNAFLVLPDKVVKGNIVIENGKISKIDANDNIDGNYTIIDASGKYVIPGFIDAHTNGMAGFDLTSGVYDLAQKEFVLEEGTYLQGLENALREYAKTGATRVALTSLAAPLEQIKKVFGYINKYKTENAASCFSDVLAGLYIEGTFMKLMEYRGAHNPCYFNEPSVELFRELYEAAGKNIKIVNVVPEWGDSALTLIDYLSANNIICAAGHTGANGIQYDKAIKHGLKLAVHFLNGPTGSSSKSLDGGGAVENVLKADNMSVELIVDGYHVDKSYVLDTIARKGFEKVIAITDSMFAARVDDLNEFEVHGVNGVISPNREYIRIADREYALFGSTLTMDAAFSNLLTWLTTSIEGVWHRTHKPLEFEDALIKVSGMCSKNPAEILGIYTSKEEGQDCTGSLEEGKNADIIIAGIFRRNDSYKVEIENVFIKGILVN